MSRGRNRLNCRLVPKRTGQLNLAKCVSPQSQNVWAQGLELGVPLGVFFAPWGYRAGKIHDESRSETRSVDPSSATSPFKDLRLGVIDTREEVGRKVGSLAASSGFGARARI